MAYRLQSISSILKTDLWDFVRTNSPTLARHGDALGYKRIWATLPWRTVFWDGAPSPYKWFQSHAL